MIEQTLILIKPDGVARGLIGEVLSRIERKGLRVVAMKMLIPTAEVAQEHYAEHADKPFFGELIDFITSGPVVAAVLEGNSAIAAFRQLAGGTDPVASAMPGSIRGDFGLVVSENIVHGSDSAESAHREIGVWFPEYMK